MSPQERVLTEVSCGGTRSYQSSHREVCNRSHIRSPANSEATFQTSIGRSFSARPEPRTASTAQRVNLSIELGHKISICSERTPKSERRHPKPPGPNHRTFHLSKPGVRT